jgi:DNA-binding NtrC family response regulator
MPTLPNQSQPAALLSKLTTHGTATQRNVRALVVSPQLEVRRTLLRTLEVLCADVTVCSTREQAEDVLSRQAVEIVFCDDYLPDGSYADLIHGGHYGDRIPRVVVTTRTGEWELYFQAVAKGAFDVIRSPWYATDVELTVIRALREEDRPEFSRAALSRAAVA